MVQWEYKTIHVAPTAGSVFGTKKINPDELFNQMGDEGWELVNTISTTQGNSKLGFQAFFKRPKAV
jgi:hypothetical protein